MQVDKTPVPKQPGSLELRKAPAYGPGQPGWSCLPVLVQYSGKRDGCDVVNDVAGFLEGEACEGRQT